MKIRVNSELYELNDGDRVIILLKQLDLEGKKGFAVAVNAEVVPRSRWNDFLLHEEDEIIIISAAQGG
jgi:sulfur carrier protein